MCKKSFLIVILLLTTVICYSDDILSYNGNQWVEWPMVAKQIFLIGMAQGEYLVRMTLYDIKELAVLEAVDNIMIDKRTVNEVVRAIDKFYAENKDKLDIPICIVYAMTLR